MTASSRRRVVRRLPWSSAVARRGAAWRLPHRRRRQDGQSAKEGARAKGAAGRAGDGRRACCRKPCRCACSAIGNVEAFSTVPVKARVDGQIADVNFKEGEPVKKGDVLFRIDPRPLRGGAAPGRGERAARRRGARPGALAGEALPGAAREELHLQGRLRADPHQRRATAEATARASQAALENARLNLEYCTIRSPLDGYVGKVLLQAGNMVQGERRQSAAW